MRILLFFIAAVLVFLWLNEQSFPVHSPRPAHELATLLPHREPTTSPRTYYIKLPSASAAAILTRPHRKTSGLFSQLPMHFEPNFGQLPPEALYCSRGGGFQFFLTQDAAVWSLRQGGDGDNKKSVHSRRLQMRCLNADRNARVAGAVLLVGKSHYYHGVDRSLWIEDVPHFGELEVQEIYTGVDIVYHGESGQLEYDFVVKPGGEADAIRLAFDGADSIELDAAGDLVLKIGGSVVRHRRPVAYQEIGGQRRDVSARFVIDATGGIGFAVADYDRSKSIVIDPTIAYEVLYARYLGGHPQDSRTINSERALGVSADANGNAYVTGYTDSLDFPVTDSSSLNGTADPNALQDNYSTDVFVSELSPDGTQLIFSTFIGSDTNDYGQSIAVDAVGNIWVAGAAGVAYAYVPFPVTDGPPVFSFSGQPPGFVADLFPNGALRYCTVTSFSDAVSIAADNSGNAYITGWQPRGNANLDGYIAKYSVGGMQWSQAIQFGSQSTKGVSIAVDVNSPGGAPLVAVAGYTSAFDGGTGVPIQTAGNHGPGQGFLSVFKALDGSPVFTKTLTGNTDVFAHGVDVRNNFVYVSGFTGANFTPKFTQTVPANVKNPSLFIVKYDATGNVVYSSGLGGDIGDGYFSGLTYPINFRAGPSNTLSVDELGNAYFAANTSGTVVAALDATGTGLAVGAVFLGTCEATAVKYLNKQAYVAGTVVAGESFVAPSSAIVGSLSGPQDAFVAKVGSCSSASLFTPTATSGSFSSYDWNMNWNLSDYDGLTLTNVMCGNRPMANMMSVPYVKIASSLFKEVRCELLPTNMHSTDANHDGPMTAENHYRSQLVDFKQLDPAGPEGNAIEATWQLDEFPNNSTLVVTIKQRYEFHQTHDPAVEPQYAGDFSAVLNKRLIDPLSQLTFAGVIVPIAKFYPMVSYKICASNDEKLKSLNIVERLHLQISDKTFGDASNIPTLFKDCDQIAGTAAYQAFKSTGNPLFSAKQNPLTYETRAVAIKAGQGGTWDNFHQSQSSDAIDEPFILFPTFADFLKTLKSPANPLNLFALLRPKPGCAECIHIHWRWGRDVSNLVQTLVPVATQYNHGNVIVPMNSGKPSDQTVYIGFSQFNSPAEVHPADYTKLIQGRSLLDAPNVIFWYE